MVSTAEITELRKKTGAGVGDCKKALEQSGGDFDKAVTYLRAAGLAGINERLAKTANEGTVGYYIHMGGKIGVLVEVNCETDFVSRSDVFQKFSKDIAMHIAAMNPKWIDKNNVPQSVIEREIDIIRASISNKPLDAEAKIIEGKLNKFYRETCLMEQPFVRDDTITIRDLLGELASKVNEKMVIKRFVRFETGEDSE